MHQETQYHSSLCGGQIIIFREDSFKMNQDFILLNERIMIEIMVSFILFTAQRMKFYIKDFFSKCDQIRKKPRVWSYLLKKSLMENYFLFSQLFHDGGSSNIGTSPLICRANQWTGFYMIQTYVMKELNLQNKGSNLIKWMIDRSIGELNKWHCAKSEVFR